MATESHAGPTLSAGIPPVRAVPVTQRASHHAAIGALCGAVLVAATLMSIQGHERVRIWGFQQPLPQLCTYRRWTGHECPGCGLTRSFIAMAHGQWSAAWHYHPFGAMLFVYCAVQVVFRGAQIVRIKQGLRAWRLGQWHNRLVYLYFGMFSVFAVTRLIIQWWPST